VTTPVVAAKGVRTGDEREAIERAGGRLLLSGAPFPLAEGLTTTGEIPRETDFEGPGKRFFTVRDGEVVQDSLPTTWGLSPASKGRGSSSSPGAAIPGL